MASYTKHAVERLKERFPDRLEEGVHPLVMMNRLFSKATRDRSFINNSKMIVKMLMEKGDFNYDYYVNGDIVFVVTNDTVVTVIDRGDSGMRNVLGAKTTSRFRKRASA